MRRAYQRIVLASMLAILPSMLHALALALGTPTLLPRVDARATGAHDLGLDADLRGLVELEVLPTFVQGADFRLAASLGLSTWFRGNNRTESPVRLSPQQIRYPVALHLWFDSDLGPIGPFVFHQSNHDVDTDDARLNRETVAYEVYGCAWQAAAFRLDAGIYYDRGTTLALKKQIYPFDHFLLGAHLSTRNVLPESLRPLDLIVDLEAIAHRGGDESPPFVDLNASVDLGVRLRGNPPGAGTLRPLLRLQRLENYQHLGDPAHLVLMLGLEVSSAAPSRP